VALVNDYDIVVAGLEHLLAPHASRVEVVAESVGPDEGLAAIVDVALLDTYGLSSFTRLDALVAHPGVHHVAVFTFGFDEQVGADVLARGARGYLSKATTAERLVEDLLRIAAGEVVVRPPEAERVALAHWPGGSHRLTERESHILAMLATGLRNADIARALFLSVDTVKTHLRSVYRKLGVTNRAQAVAVALSDRSFARRASAAPLPAEATRPPASPPGAL
jgi:DNA-binding NarL/FixJ family response regulator